jgi:hypothetical protein
MAKPARVPTKVAADLAAPAEFSYSIRKARYYLMALGISAPHGDLFRKARLLRSS